MRTLLLVVGALVLTACDATHLLPAAPSVVAVLAPQASDTAGAVPHLTATATAADLSIQGVVNISGGADDDPRLYCPSIVIEWGDGLGTTLVRDCEPYHPGVIIQRRFTSRHVYAAPGAYVLTVRVMQGGTVITSGVGSITVPLDNVTR